MAGTLSVEHWEAMRRLASLGDRFFRLGIKAHLTIAVILFALFILWDESLPLASPKIEVTRGQSRQIAERFLEQRGLSVEGSHHSSVFGYSDQSQVFIDRALGQKALERLQGAPVRLWWWENRWFKDGAVQEDWVDVSLDGRVTYFWHKLADEDPGGDLGRDAAYALALGFLDSQQLQETSLELLDESSQSYDYRTDYTFTWDLKGFVEADSRYRYDVRVQGDQIGSYQESLRRPESWVRSYTELRARNGAASQVAGTFGGVLSCLVVLALLAHLVKGETTPEELGIPQAPWRDWWSWKKSNNLYLQGFRQSYLFRCFCLTAVVVGLGEINELPLALYAHQTTDSYSQTVVEALLWSFTASVCWGLWFVVLCWSCGVLFRVVYPSQIPFSKLFGWQTLRLRGFAERVALGLVLLGVHALFFRTFYWIAEGLGAWSPASVSYVGLLTGYLPWATALNVGFLAAVGEELVYRVFAITWLKRMGASNWLAVTLPALLWGFQHCFYPQQPFFIRGLELTLLGIVYGIFFLKWGPIPGLVAHFSWNAYASSGVLIKSHEPYLVLSGVVCAGALFWVLLASLYVRRRWGVLDYEQEAPDVPKPGPLEVVDVDEPPVRGRILLFGLALVSIVSTAGYLGSEPPLAPVNVSASQAVERAREDLRQRGIDVTGYKVALSTFEGLGARDEYLWRRGGIELYRQTYSGSWNGTFWQVRFFQPSVLQEYFLRVDASSGALVYYRSSLAEVAPGANLKPKQAEKLARDLVRQRSGHEPGKVVSSKAVVRPHRTDHEFSFVAQGVGELDLGDARVLDSVEVQGDVPQAFVRYLDINDSWWRCQRESRWWQMLGGFLVASVLGSVAIFGGRLGLKRIVGAEVRGADLGRLLLLVLFIGLLQIANTLPYEWSEYSTVQHPWSFWAATLSESLQQLVGVAIGLSLLWLSVAVLNPVWLRPTADHRRLAIPVALLGVALRLGVDLGDRLLRRLFYSNLDPDLPTTLGLSVLPTLQTVCYGITAAVFLTLIVGFLGGILARSRARVVLAALTALGAGVALASLEKWTDLGPTLLLQALVLGLAFGLWKGLLRRNPLAWFHFAFLYSLTEGALATLGHPVLTHTGYCLLIIAVFWTLFWWRQGQRSSHPTQLG